MRRCLLIASVAACSPSSPPAPLDPPVYETATATSPESASMSVSAAPSASAMPSVASTPTPEAPLAVSCRSDSDCGWDDPCVPSACVAAQPGRSIACDKSRPPDGTCLCVEGICSKKPQNPVAASGTCEVRGCVVDAGRGRCIADTGGVAEGLRTNRHVNEGPSCDCINPKSGCQFNWFDAVPCKSELDCWISDDPRPRPVPRPKHLRRPFKPCSDGETAPKCEAGKCRIGPHYKC